MLGIARFGITSTVQLKANPDARAVQSMMDAFKRQAELADPKSTVSHIMTNAAGMVTIGNARVTAGDYSRAEKLSVSVKMGTGGEMLKLELDKPLRRLSLSVEERLMRSLEGPFEAHFGIERPWGL